jgi:hypothetical protein
LRAKAIDLKATVYALNGMPDHVHMVVSIPPKIAVATFIGQIKAVAATHFNKLRTSTTLLFWQAEYGVFSFDKKRLPNIITYVERQKQHHAENSTIPLLERDNDSTSPRLREETLSYTTDYALWHHEMMSIKSS